MDGDSSEDEVEFDVEAFQIANETFNLTTVAFMPVTKLMQLSSTETEISGQKVWCGSLGIAELFLNKREYVIGKQIIELGAGTGILGMLCKRLGAASVHLTDHDPKSLEHMAADCVRNNVEASVTRLDWFDPTLTALNIDTSSSDEGGVVIIAGDVIYKSTLVTPFMETVSTLLTHYPRSVFYLCHIPRGGPRVEYEHVEQAATAQGISFEVGPEDEWKRGSCLEEDYVPTEDVSRARVYIMRATV
jgi:predicted nicotinamide N-methyase